MTSLVISIGSNQGNRLSLIYDALRALMLHFGPTRQLSGVYLSEPWGFESTVCFLNGVAVFDTTDSPSSCLHICRRVEEDLGRVRKPGSGYTSRTIDIDILFYGKDICHDSELTIPHPRLHLRRFVLLPLSEILPDYVHPVLHKSIAELLTDCTDTGKVNCLGKPREMFGGNL